MKLFSRWRNSAGERVRIALNIKGIEYQYVAAATLPPGEYRRMNPQGLLPTLEVDGVFIPQSAAILAYLEETFPSPPLLSPNPALRAAERAFGAYIAAEMHAVTVNRVHDFVAHDLGLGEAGMQRWLSHWLTTGFAALEAALANRERQWPFCFGDAPGWADIHLIPQMGNGRRFKIDLVPYRRLLAVEANCVGLDAFRRARPEAQSDAPGDQA